MGRIATTQLADLVQITPGNEVLDAGSGIGGTARYVAERSRCHVVAVDSPRNIVRPHGGSTSLSGLDDRIYRAPSRRHGPAFRGRGLHA